MNILSAAAKAAGQIAEGRFKAENSFAQALSKKVLYIGEKQDFGKFLEEQGVTASEYEVQGPDGSFVLFFAKDKVGEVLVTTMFEWSSEMNDGVITVQIKGSHLDMTTAQLDEAIALIEKDNESKEEEKECDCPACQLRRMLRK